MVVSQVGGHVVALVAQQPRNESIVSLGTFVDREVGTRGESFVYYVCMDQGTAPPDEATRAALRALGDRMSGRMLGVAAVIDLPGFTGAALRGAVTSIGLALRRRMRLRAFDLPEPAAAWARELPGPTHPPRLTGAELHAAREALRARIAGAR
jgi:hypothetical protein